MAAKRTMRRRLDETLAEVERLRERVAELEAMPRWEPAREDRPEAIGTREQKMRDSVLAEIQRCPGVFRYQIGQALGVTKGQVQNALEALRARKLVRMQRAGSWTRYYAAESGAKDKD